MQVRLAAGVFLAVCLAAPCLADVALTTEAWENSDTDFARFSQHIADLHGRNLLARRGVRVACERLNPSNARMLTDGRAGERCEEGRVFVDGQPSIITFYLGGPKTITEVAMLTFNVDTRANQDYEVRFADNSSRPGQMPSFPEKPDLTTGDKILGQNGGGFRTRFADSAGGPLRPGKVDWVQFRIWRTYSHKAGQPAKTTGPQGGSTIIEFQVLGEAGDAIVPTPEEIARQKAIAAAPKQPQFERRQTWQETLLAAREALLEWEQLQDRLALPGSDASLGPWHVLGPLPARSKDLRDLRSQSKIDLAKRYPGKDGKEIGWETCDAIADGKPADLTALRGADKDDVFLLCRPVTLYSKHEDRMLSVAISADRASAWWLPDRRGVGVRSPASLVREAQELSGEPGEYQLLIELRAGGEGRHRIYVQPQSGLVKPGAGTVDTRRNRRRQLLDQLYREFSSPADRLQIGWELADDVWGSREQPVEDWLPGQAETYLQANYQKALDRRLQRLTKDMAETAGVQAMATAPIKQRLQAWVAQYRESVRAEALTSAQLRERYYQVAAVQESVALAGQVRSLRLAVEDHRDTFKDRYPKAAEYLARATELEKRIDAGWDRLLTEPRAAQETLTALRQETEVAKQAILLDTPLLAFGKLLVARGGAGFASNWGGPNHIGSEIAVLSPVRPDGSLSTVYRGGVSDMDLHWDAERLLFSDGNALWEIRVDGTGLRRVSAEDPPVRHYDGCYLPDGKIVCVSNACEQAVPCTGEANVGNLHLLDADGKNERRLSFDQDHDWNPVVMNDGRVLYSRWEYTDLPHYFSRMLFRMNPDGSGQMEYYGSNSYWPNAMYWPRPIPGHPTMVSCVVSGHHGVSRVGELVILDPARGRFEADGVVQRIPGYGQKVEPIIQDNLVGESWPKFAAPYPLAEEGTNAGAGKYFLVCVKNDEHAPWVLCLVDVFDNITPILADCMTPIPLRKRPMPPAVPSHLDLNRNDGLIYLTDVYQGDGLRGYPRGSIKALRIGSHHYRYPGNGDTYASSFEGGWDVKKILGTVPVNEDGSALFRVPANTPIFVQPLDAEGKAQQQMRSWYTAMPGERTSCIGCHERQNEVPPSRQTIAATKPPSEIQPWFGPTRGFSFDREVQPVLDRRCAGCHNGQPYRDGEQTVSIPDLRAKQLHQGYDGRYSPAYLVLQRYVRRAGYEADNHMLVPAEFEADTSTLVQMLKKGHHNVQLTRDEWQQLYTWIDFNVPYPANWRESHVPPQDDQVARRAQYKKLYAGIDDRDEESLPLPPVAAFEPPTAEPPKPEMPAAPANWPMTDEQAKRLQQAAGPWEKELELPGGAKMKFVLVPAGEFVMGDPAGFADERAAAVVRIERPFYLGQFEVTNAQYAAFNAKHDSGYVEGRNKDRTTRGTPIGAPDLPAVRVTWHEAMAFCRWLSDVTGQRVTLPTEAQWEWACRAGTQSAFHAADTGKPFANLADESIARWNYGRVQDGYRDGISFTAPGGRFAPNAWGLHDMHGNVAEWCLTSYRAYPYRDDGRNDPRSVEAKVIRGGSWNDTFRYAGSASRWRYPPHQPVYNVGFRVLLEPGPHSPIARRD